MNELEKVRADRQAAFHQFVEESNKASKHSLKAKAARHAYMLARAEERELERDLLATTII